MSCTQPDLFPYSGSSLSSHRSEGMTDDHSTTTEPTSPGIFSRPSRTDTGNTQETGCTSIIEPASPWATQLVLSFDGGGIRGYSSLLIMRALMDLIAKIEQEPPTSPSSFYPKDPPTYSYANGDETERQELGGSPFRQWREQFRRKRDLAALTRRGTEIQNESGESSRLSTEAQARQIRDKYLPCHYFDYIGGTSTGGLISIMLSRLRMSTDSAIEEYEHLAGYIFGHPRIFSIRGPIPFPRDKYNSKRVVDVFEHVVSTRLCGKRPLMGQNLFASHERMCKTIVVSYMSQRVEDRGVMTTEPPYIFRSYDHHPEVQKDQSYHNLLERNPGYAHRVPIWQVARATSAAPTYFHPITIEDHKFLDGGFGTNNPTKEIYREVYLMNGNNKRSIGLVVSIGTGESWVSKFGSGTLAQYLAYIRAGKHVVTNSDEVHAEMRNEEFPPGGDRGDRYYRFNVPLSQRKKDNAAGASSTSPDLASRLPKTEVRRKSRPLSEIPLDEWKTGSRIFRRNCNTTLEDIKAATDEYLATKQVQDDLEKVGRILVARRRARCRHGYWEIVSTGAQYRCVVQGCHSLKSQKMREKEKSLRSHLKAAHGIVNEQSLDEYVHLGRCMT
ncbi:acyl transferase/acyl hydrolase/lysophospholipase [Tricladium varicosporioides]|nr:acyl transferase/acyl hydrolase/lysophospholipase [Hymenoscyphus varicosporioides]